MMVVAIRGHELKQWTQLAIVVVRGTQRRDVRLVVEACGR